MMCIGESASDTLRFAEQTFLRQAAADRLPDYSSEVRTNDDAITWVVLAPEGIAVMPRFTVCSIDPCIMVLVEDATKPRQFASLASVEDALDFACSTIAAARAHRNVHTAPAVAQ